MYTIQFKEKGSNWQNDANFESSSDRQPLAKQALELAKANPGIAFRVHTEPKVQPYQNQSFTSGSIN